MNSLRELVIASDVLEKDKGGDALGFGLMSRYPIAVQKGQANLQQFTGALKGGDAMIRTACQELGFKVSVKVLYKTSDYSPHRWLADTMLSDWDLGDCEDDLVDRIRNAATLIKSRAPGDDDEDEDEDVDEDEDRSDDEDSVGGGGRGIGLIWVTKPSHMVRTDLAYLSFGNEPSMGYVYGELVLIATPTKHSKARMAGERVSVTPPPAKGMTKELKAALDVMHKAFTDAMKKQKEAEEAKKKAEFDGSTYDFDNLEQLSKEPRKMLFKLAAYCKVSGAGTNQAILDRIIESRKNDSGSD